MMVLFIFIKLFTFSHGSINKGMCPLMCSGLVALSFGWAASTLKKKNSLIVMVGYCLLEWA